jgi:hypothetical protein
LLAPNPQLAELVVFIVKLYVHIALLEVRQGHAIFFTNSLFLVLFEVIYFWDKDLFQPNDGCAALESNAGEISVDVKLAVCLGKLTRPHLLPTSGYNFWRSLPPLPRWGSASLSISRLPLP